MKKHRIENAKKNIIPQKIKEINEMCRGCTEIACRRMGEEDNAGFPVHDGCIPVEKIENRIERIQNKFLV